MSEPTFSTPLGRAPVIPVVLLGIGAYLTWFGVHYFDSDTKWPTDPIKDVLTGKPLPVPSGQTSAAQTAASVEQIAGAVSNQVGPAGSAPAVSGAYTLPEIETLWTSQGGSGETAFEAANVAMAESSGNADATSANPDGGTNVGLWQLDTKGVGAGYTEDQLKDPATNARITIMHTANGTNWSQWADSVVQNGVYVGPKV
jgi:Lysozyme like domain